MYTDVGKEVYLAVNCNVTDICYSTLAFRSRTACSKIILLWRWPLLVSGWSVSMEETT